MTISPRTSVRQIISAPTPQESGEDVVRTKAVVVFGVGHHARRIYIPALLKNKQLEGLQIVTVDIREASPVVNAYIKQISGKGRITAHYLEELDPQRFEATLGQALMQRYDIVGVIISTDPQNHMQYATWALKNNLHVLMDKPISTYENMVDDVAAAERLKQDYDELMALYAKGESIFCLNTQRRYESGYAFVDELVAEVRDRFGMPITSLQTYYSDGLWIFPDEIMRQKVHPFNRGYGMLSHSAFHLLDAAWQLYSNSFMPGKSPDAIETHASGTYPDGLMQNFGSQDYARTFGAPTNTHDDAYYVKAMAGFGEMDVFANFLLKKGAIPTGGITVNLLHNSFSRRSWPKPNEDLYKGNGRVKHQSYIIQQGPFQSIQIHNYQAVHEHDTQDEDDSYALGGKNHFDIHVFRNADMFSKTEVPLRIYSAKELDALYAANSTKLSCELAKDLVVEEFINNCHLVRSGFATRDTVKMRNSLHTYEVPVKMMAAVYKSLALRRKGANPIITESL